MAAVDEEQDPSAIVGETEVTEADLAHAITRLSGATRPWLVPGALTVALLVAWGMNPNAIRSASMLPIVLPIAFVTLMSSYLQRMARRAWVKQALANVGGQTKFCFDDYGFSSESSLRQHRLAWASIARALETPWAFLVYTTPQTVLIVPKRAFTDGGVARLSRLLPERIVAKPLPKAPAFVGLQPKTLLLWLLLLFSFLTIWHFLADRGGADRDGHRSRAGANVPERPRRGAESSDVDSSP